MTGSEVLQIETEDGAEWTKEEDGWIYSLHYSRRYGYSIEAYSPDGAHTCRRVSVAVAAAWLEDFGFATPRA